MKKTLKNLFPALAGLVLSSGFACAQTIVVDPVNPESTNVSSVTPTYGFSLYDAAPNGKNRSQETNDLPSFVTAETFNVLVNGNPSEYPQGATTFTVDGTPYSTGELNNNSFNTNGASLLDTLTLGNTIPAAFELGVLTDVQGNPGYPTAITVVLKTPGGLTLSSAGPDGTSSGTITTSNDIANFIVTGAQAGDTLSFYATSSGYDSIGGITFSAVVAPEPSTWALLLFGLGAIGFVVSRRRRLQA
jgi:hypothetical protein